MNIRHKYPCECCLHRINGPHSLRPGAEAHARAESMRADGWKIISRFAGCMWHGEWMAYPPGDDWPAWHCAMTLEDLLHAMDTRPADNWDREIVAEHEASLRARPAPAPVPDPEHVRPYPPQLSLFA